MGAHHYGVPSFTALYISRMSESRFIVLDLYIQLQGAALSYVYQLFDKPLYAAPVFWCVALTDCTLSGILTLACRDCCAYSSAEETNFESKSWPME